jgi:hypothetical protein
MRSTASSSSNEPDISGFMTIVVGAVVVMVLVIVGFCVWAMTGAPAQEYAASASSSRSSSSKGEKNFIFEWLQFNRGREDGESADAFFAANCKMAVMMTGTRGRSWDEIDRSCKEVGKATGGTWVRPPPSSAPSKPVKITNPWDFKPF